VKLPTTSIFLATITFCILILIVGFGPTLSSLYRTWVDFDATYGHGLLILAISIYLIYESIPRLKSIRIVPFIPAVFPLLLLSLCWYIGYMIPITTIEQLVLPLIILSSITVISGVRMAVALLFPVLFLYFAIPVWDSLTDTLVNLTVVVVKKLLFLSNVSAFIEGNIVQLVVGKIIVADSCSGIRYLIIGTALSFLNAALNFHKLNARIAIIIGGIALSLIANWVRVYSLIMIGHHTRMQSSLMTNHEYFGWLVFILVMAPLFIANRFIPDSNKKEAPSSSEADISIDRKTMKPIAIASLFAFLALFTGPVLVQFTPLPENTEFDLAFTHELDWESHNPTRHNWTPTLPDPYKHISQRLTSGGQSLNLHVYAYRKQSDNAKLFPYFVSIYDKRTWHMIDSKTASVKSKQATITLNKTRLKRNGATTNHSMWYWFNVGGINTASYKIAKLSQIVSRLSKKNYAFIYVIERKCTMDSCEESNNILADFIARSDLDVSSLMGEQREKLIISK
jgi:exosortase A